MAFTRSPSASPELKFRIARIPKGGGNFREIYIASPEGNRKLRALLPELESVLANVDECRANYAFEKGKNCALNALQHIGYRYTLSMDLEDYFNSVSAKHITDLIPSHITEQCLVHGHPKQGLPTSPLVATIAFTRCDKRLVNLLKKLGICAVYTRYADDLVFSFDNRKDAGKIRVIVRQAIDSFGFKVNERKTRLQDARNGRRIITGVAVDDAGIHPTRRTRRKIRAAIHQGNSEAVRGLEEWSKCKLPRSL